MTKIKEGEEGETRMEQRPEGEGEREVDKESDEGTTTEESDGGLNHKENGDLVINEDNLEKEEEEEEREGGFATPEVSISTMVVDGEEEEGGDDEEEEGNGNGGQNLVELERDHKQLATLISLKEKEWDTLLKFKKLSEIRISREKRIREIHSLLGKKKKGGKPPYITYRGPAALLTKRMETESRNNLKIWEKKVRDLAKELFEEGNGGTDSETEQTNASTSSALFATNALKNLVKDRNNRVQTAGSSKGVGEGRLGKKVEVSSLIAEHRWKTESSKRNASKVSGEPRRRTTLQHMNFDPALNFREALEKALRYDMKHRELSTNLISLHFNQPNLKTVTSMKTNKNTNTTASASTSKGVSGGGTTLAKLLSSSNGSSSSRSIEESFNHKSSPTHSAGSEKSLSLATLLASSKGRDDPQKKKSEPSTSAATTTPVCQGCHANKAQFVCAGCANQWYCSRECQVASWDSHSESCSG